MPSLDEAQGQGGFLPGPLHAGVNTISEAQEICFVKYVRVVMPLDGYTFWVKADLLSTAAVFNAAMFNAVPLDQPPAIATAANVIKVMASLHYTTDGRQNESETIAIHRVEVTSEEEVTALAEVAPNFLYIATLPDGNRYSFSGRRSFYDQSKLWHYFGDAVYAPFETQVLDSLPQLDTRSVIVSNSLPFWLGMDMMNPPLGWFPPTQRIPLYPSFAVPDNLPPPYGAVHIEPGATRAMQSAPAYDSDLSHSQLAYDRVEITLWGLRNFNAQDFVDYVGYYSLRTENIGIMNMPIIRDEKETQLELSALGMKKKVTFEVNYNQQRVREVVRQMILSVVPSFDIHHWPLYHQRGGRNRWGSQV